MATAEDMTARFRPVPIIAAPALTPAPPDVIAVATCAIPEDIVMTSICTAPEDIAAPAMITAEMPAMTPDIIADVPDREALIPTFIIVNAAITIIDPAVTAVAVNIIDDVIPALMACIAISNEETPVFTDRVIVAMAVVIPVLIELAELDMVDLIPSNTDRTELV